MYVASCCPNNLEIWILSFTSKFSFSSLTNQTVPSLNMAISSSSSISISKLDFPVSFSQSINKKNSISSIPFCRKYITKNFFISSKTPKSCGYISNSLVNDSSIDETSKESITQVPIEVKTR